MRAHLTHGNRYNEELLTTISDVTEGQAAIKKYMADMEVYLQVRNAAPRAAKHLSPSHVQHAMNGIVPRLRRCLLLRNSSTCGS